MLMTSQGLTRRLLTIATMAGFMITPAFAYEAPVVSGNAVAPSSEQPLIPVNSDNSDIAVQQQVTAQEAEAPAPDNSGNLPNQVQLLQQQVQNLQGQLEMQSHQIAQMQSLQMSQYQDLDRRINLLAQGKRSEATQALVTASTATASAMPAAPAAIDANPEAPLPKAPAVAAASTVAPPPPVAPVVNSEQAMYQQAYNQLGKQQYTAAKTGFQAYLKQYPNGTYAADSHYWLGELALVMGDNANATKEFTTVTQQFASSPRVPASWMRLGGIYTAAGNTAQAKEAYNAVIRRFPNSSEAVQAKQQLSQL